MSKSYGLVVVMVGFLVGLFLQDLWGRGEGFWFVCVVLVFVGVWWKMSGKFLVVVLFCLGCVVGMGRYAVSDMVFEGDVTELAGNVVDVRACVSEEVDVRVDKVKYTVSDVCSDEGCYDGRLLLNAGRYPVYKYGDVIRVVGEVSVPESFEGFDYGRYLSRFGVGVVMSQPRITVVEVGGCGWSFYKGIYDFKGVFEKRLGRLFPEPYSSLMAGLLLGSRKGIPADLMEDFNKTGLTHIVAISGYNITLVIIVVFGLFGFLTRKVRVVMATIFVVVFVILVGASSAVVRAGIMGIISLFAVYFGRKGEIYVSILLAAFLMNLWNPKIAVIDIGFQLSFLATLGLVYVSPWLEKAPGLLGKILGKVPRFFLIRENFVLTLSAQVFTLPVILKSFGRISLLCPISNVFVLPFIPFAMIFGFLAVVGSFVVEGVGEGFAFVGYCFLDLIFFLVRFFAGFSTL